MELTCCSELRPISRGFAKLLCWCCSCYVGVVLSGLAWRWKMVALLLEASRCSQHDIAPSEHADRSNLQNGLAARRRQVFSGWPGRFNRTIQVAWPIGSRKASTTPYVCDMPSLERQFLTSPGTPPTDTPYSSLATLLKPAPAVPEFSFSFPHFLFIVPLAHHIYCYQLKRIYDHSLLVRNIRAFMLQSVLFRSLEYNDVRCSKNFSVAHGFFF